MPQFRPNVEAMEPYVPGEQPAAGTKVIKLNTNENPYPPSPKVTAAIQAELQEGGDRLRVYSDPQARALREAGHAQTGFPIEQVLHGNGSDELLAMLVRAYVGEGDTIAYPYPTYVLYETLAHAQGARIVTHDLKPDFSLPDELFGCDAKLVFIACPNSPMGNVYPIKELERLAKSLRGGVLAIDEAYAAFADESALELARSLENVVVLRTFSKSHSLAGMRLGLLFGSSEIVSGLWKVKDSYNLDRLAILAGAASLNDPDWTRANCEKIRATRGRLLSELTAMGLDVIPSQANFVFAQLGDAAQAVGAYRFLKEKGVLVRYFPARRLDRGLRITVGTDAEIDALLAKLKEYLGRG